MACISPACNPEYYNVNYDVVRRSYVYSPNFPYPFYYWNPVPNLSSGPDNCPIGCGSYYGFKPSFDPVLGTCHDPLHTGRDGRSDCRPDPRCEKYNYLVYQKGIANAALYCNRFTIDVLVSNVPSLCTNYDINLLNPWGIVVSNDIVWVASSATGLVIAYNLSGGQILPAINVYGPADNISSPTGIAINYNQNAFMITSGRLTLPAIVLIATRDGTISGYNASLNTLSSYMIINNSMNSSVYTGIAAACDFVYVADFYNRRVDVFNGKYKKVTDFPFVDEYSTDPIPEDYAPYNIVIIVDKIYVVYARQNPSDNQFVDYGEGTGYISIFRLDGTFVRRYVSRRNLNAPWGLVLAPSIFGFPAGSIMVANYGDSTISVFDADGKCLGKLQTGNMTDIVIDGIRGLAVNPNYERIVYWSASPDNLSTAMVGIIGNRPGCPC